MMSWAEIEVDRNCMLAVDEAVLCRSRKLESGDEIASDVSGMELKVAEWGKPMLKQPNQAHCSSCGCRKKTKSK